MKRYVLPGLVLAALTLSAPFASAQIVSGPDSQACADAEAALAAAVAPVVTYNPNVYPGDVVPAVKDVTPELLAAVLADVDLGGGARLEVEAAVTAFQEAAAACAEPVPTTTPAPTTTTEPTTTAPATPSAPTTTPDVDDEFDQVGRVPVGGVATGG